MNKKRNIIIILTSIIFSILLSVSLFFTFYRASDLGHYKNLSINNNFVYYSDYNDFISEIKTENETHYVYIGKPTCPWCQAYVSYYDEAAKKHDKKIDYFNTDTIKLLYEKENSDGTINLTVDPRYASLVDYLSSYDPEMKIGFWNYRLTPDSKGIPHLIKWLYVPGLFKIENGKVVDFVGEIKGHEVDSNHKLRDLTEEESKDFKETLNIFFS